MSLSLVRHPLPPCVAGVYVWESLGSLIYGAKRNRRRRWTMIYRPRINCGYLHSCQRSSLHTRGQGTQLVREGWERRGRGDWKNQVEFIVTIDSGGYIAHTLYAYTYAHALYARGVGRGGGEGGQKGVLVYKFLRLPRWNPAKPWNARGFIAGSVAHSRFRWIAPLSLFPLSPFLRYFFLPLLFSRYTLSLFFFLCALHVSPET